MCKEDPSSKTQATDLSKVYTISQIMDVFLTLKVINEIAVMKEIELRIKDRNGLIEKLMS